MFILETYNGSFNSGTEFTTTLITLSSMHGYFMLMECNLGVSERVDHALRVVDHA